MPVSAATHLHQHQAHVNGFGFSLAYLLSSSLSLFLSFSSYIQLQSEDRWDILCKQSMSRRNGNVVPKIELKLNLSPPRANPMESPRRSGTVSPTSPPSSCVSSENQEDTLRCSNSPEAATSSMLLVGCPRCLMYVMLSEDNPKCLKCKSTVLLDFLHDNNTTAKTRKS